MAAEVLPNPRFEGALSVPTSGGDADVLGYGAGVTWNVSPLLSRRARVSAAERNLVSVELDIGWQEWQVAQSARLHAIRAINLTCRVEVARELEARGSSVSSPFARPTSNAVTELELTNAKRSHAEARVKALDLLEQLLTERGSLNEAAWRRSRPPGRSRSLLHSGRVLMNETGCPMRCGGGGWMPTALTTTPCGPPSSRAFLPSRSVRAGFPCYGQR